MVNKWFLTIVGLGVVCLAPIWRGAGHSRHDGVPLWKLIYDSTHLTPDSPFGHAHLPYDEAVDQVKIELAKLYQSQVGEL
jgi:hypothetical protein